MSGLEAMSLGLDLGSQSSFLNGGGGGSGSQDGVAVASQEDEEDIDWEEAEDDGAPVR